MLKTLLLSLVIVVLFSRSADGLSCLVCSMQTCPSLPGPCNSGVGKDPCGCCDVCSKGPGEECGGPFDILGLCGTNLNCDKSRSPEVEFNARGVCVGPQLPQQPQYPQQPQLPQQPQFPQQPQLPRQPGRYHRHPNNKRRTDRRQHHGLWHQQ